MSLRSLEYAVSESLTAVRRNFLMALASILMTTLTLGVLGGFSLSALAINNAAMEQLQRFEISVWMNRELSDKQAEECRRKMLELPHVSTVRFVSAAETKRMIESDLEGIDPQTIDFSGLKDKMNYFRVKLDDPRFTEEALTALAGMPDVDTVLEGKGIVEKMVGIADIMHVTGFGIAGLLLLMAVFVISQTIRTMILFRGREIRLMRLVGASAWFVRLPFVLEGSILGTVGGALACGLVLGGAHYATRLLLSSIDYLGGFSSGIDPLWTAGGLLGLGWIIGASSSLFSIQKHLKA